jgi:type IV secretion system protein VirB9
MKLVGTLAAAALLASTPAWASVTPSPGAGDPHIQSVDYDPQQVVVLGVCLGYALTVEFSPDERIENVSVGNGAVWQASVNKSADRLFIKPMQGAADTDMTVVTDSRVYTFELRPAPTPDAFLVRFHYPAAAVAAPAKVVVETGVYRFGGARDLRPTTMTDDGRTTTITWPLDAVIPVVSIVGPDGKEALANGAVRDGRYVIDQVADRYVFRAGGRKAYAARRVLEARAR